jgi:hypothetical protein
MRRVTIVFVLIFSGQGLVAQQASADSSAAVNFMQRAKQLYNTYRGQSAGIFNGQYFYPYSPAIAGLPYFVTDSWQMGSVIYEDILYENIFMKYDLVQDQLVITPDKNKGISIALFSPRVKQFSFDGKTFVRLDKKSNPELKLEEGFYLQLAKGKLTVYSRMRKFIEEKVDPSGITRNYEEKIRYYILKKGTYYSIKSKNDLLEVVKEQRDQVQQLLNRSNLKYKRNQEESIVASVELYNQAN